MKKTFKYLFIALAATSLWACSQDGIENPPPAPDVSGVEMLFRGSHAADGTRTTLGEAGATSIPFLWSAGDYIWVEGKKSGQLVEGGAEALFPVVEMAGSDSYQVYYNMTGSAAASAYVKSTQTQAGERINLGVNGDFGYAQADSEGDFTLSHATSYIWFDTWSSSYDGRLTSITFEVADDTKAVAGKAIYDGSGFTSLSETSHKVTLEIDGGLALSTAAGNARPHAVMTLYPADLTATEVYLTYTFDDGSIFLERKSGIEIVSGRTYRISTKIDPSRPGILALRDTQTEETVLKYGENLRIDIEASGWLTDFSSSVPAGWDVDISFGGGYIDVSIPARYEEGMDIEGYIALSSAQGDIRYSIYLLDFSNPAGTFVVAEGNMTTVNGTLYYYDKLGKEYANVFEDANNNLQIGNVVQDIYMANGRIYLLTQNGNNMGGAGRFVVCDEHTLKMEYANPLVIFTPEGKQTWPQHLVVVSATKAYVQYSSSDMESSSGICALTLSDGAVQVKHTVEGTFGAFTSVGATKARMIYSRGKVYAACGHGVVIINPANDAAVEKTIPFPGRQAKDIVKAADGNLYVALASTYTGAVPNMGTIDGNPMIVGIDHAGNIVSEKTMSGAMQFPIETWSPNIGMCASFTEPYLYFRDSKAFNIMSISRYNYQTETLEYQYLSGDETIYGYMGQHPFSDELWVGTSTGYTTSRIYVYDVEGVSPVEKTTFFYGTQRGASPAGVDFAYRFSDGWINN